MACDVYGCFIITILSDYKPLLQLLRQILDQEVLFNTKKPFDRRVLEGVVLTTAMTVSAAANERKQEIPERLKV